MSGRALIFALSLALATPAAAEWETFTATDDSFSIEFPVPPTFSDIVEMQGEAIVHFHDYRALTEAGVFLVDVVRFTPAVRAARSDAELIDIAVVGVAGNDCEASEPHEVPVAGGIAHEVTFRCPDELTMRARFQLAEAWLYQIGAGGGPGIANGADSTRFLESFRLLSE